MVATFQLIDPMLIYNRFPSELDFQQDINFMTQLKGPTSAPGHRTFVQMHQMAAHASLQAQHLCLSVCSLL